MAVGSYNIPSVNGGTKPLTDPPGTGHAALHDLVKQAIDNLNVRMNAAESTLTQQTVDIEQARLAAMIWQIHGPVEVTPTDEVRCPVIWNMTGRAVTFKAARITVLNPPEGSPLEIMLYVSGPLDESARTIDQSLAGMSEILPTPMTIQPGDNMSEALDAADFLITSQPQNSCVAMRILAVGSDAPGADLTVQLNRNL